MFNILIENILPFPVYIYHYKGTDKNPLPIGKIEKRGKRIIEVDLYDRLLFTIPISPHSDENILYTKLQINKNFITKYKLGDIVYGDFGNTQIVNVNKYIDRIFFKNRLPFKVHLFYQAYKMDSIKVAILQPYDGMNYMGGSRATTIFDNANHGMRIGDIFTFFIERNKKLYPYASCTLNDNFTTEIIVGDLSEGDGNKTPADVSSYLAERTYTGITYYVPSSPMEQLVKQQTGRLGKFSPFPENYQDNKLNFEDAKVAFNSINNMYTGSTSGGTLQQISSYQVPFAYVPKRTNQFAPF